MTTEGLRIKYRRSGGFAGIDLVAEALADELPGEQADAAAQLLSGPAPPASAQNPPGMADQFSYQLHLDDGERQRTFQWAGQEVPDEARPLLATLNRRAAPARPE